jgi:hypothetical protein
MGNHWGGELYACERGKKMTLETTAVEQSIIETLSRVPVAPITTLLCFASSNLIPRLND